MGQLSTLFDWIIVDSPPLLPLADTTVWARSRTARCSWPGKERRRKLSSSAVWKF